MSSFSTDRTLPNQMALWVPVTAIIVSASMFLLPSCRGTGLVPQMEAKHHPISGSKDKCSIWSSATLVTGRSMNHQKCIKDKEYIKSMITDGGRANLLPKGESPGSNLG